LLKALDDEDKSVRIRAAGALMILGHKDKRPARLLAEALADKDDHAQQEAIDTFRNVLLPAVPILEECLKDKRPEVRQLAAFTLGEVGRNVSANKLEFPRKTIQSLIAALKDKDKDVVWGAIYALGAIGEQAKEAVPAIVECLKDPVSDVRSIAAERLRKF